MTRADDDGDPPLAPPVDQGTEPSVGPALGRPPGLAPEPPAGQPIDPPVPPPAYPVGAGRPDLTSGRAAATPEVPWRRLDARMIAVDATRLIGSLVPLALAVLLRNADASAVASTLTTLAMIGVASAVFDLLRWTTTWYRITDTRVEVRSGLVTRRHRSMPRDRIRRVDATAKVLHRVFGLAVVTLATGEHGGSDDVLKLDAVTTDDAAGLRLRLLGAAGEAEGRAGAPNGADLAGSARAASNDAGRAGGPGLGGGTATAAETVGEPADRRPGPAGDGRRDGVSTGALHAASRLAGRALAGNGDDRGTEGSQTLAVLRWAWAPYAVLSFWTLALPAVAFGAAIQGLQSVGVTVDEVATDDRVTETARGVSTTGGVVLAALALAVIGVVGALGLFVETWWGFRLAREPGRLRIHRGLLTSRSISLDEARLRGVELVEPLGLRTAGGARVHAVTTGLAGAESSRGERADALMPPAPAAEAQRVAAAVLDLADAPTDHPDLHPHPRAARRRRLTRAAAVGVLAWALLGVVHVGSDRVPLAAAVVPAALSVAVCAYALDAYASLGYRLAGRYLVVRRGSLSRRTVALQRSGIIGWTVRASLFQRRSRLATVEATTAAGRGSYPLSDVDAGAGLRLADAAVPGMLRPFLVEDRSSSPRDQAVRS